MKLFVLYRRCAPNNEYIFKRYISFDWLGPAVPPADEGSLGTMDS